MSARKFSPGDVAVVRNQFGVWNRAICAVRSGYRGFVWSYGVADDTSPMTADAHPLVVIDPEDAEQVNRLRLAVGKLGSFTSSDVIVRETQEALREFADPTPRIEEPTGLGAVVETARGDRWVMAPTEVDDDAPWLCLGPSVLSGDFEPWGRVNAVRVLSQGVPS